MKINPIIAWDYIWGKTYPKNPFLYSMQQNSFVKNLPVHLCALRCGGNFISLQYETKKVFLAKRISLLLLCWKTTQSGWMTKQKRNSIWLVVVDKIKCQIYPWENNFLILDLLIKLKHLSIHTKVENEYLQEKRINVCNVSHCPNRFITTLYPKWPRACPVVHLRTILHILRALHYATTLETFKYYNLPCDA